MAVRPAHILGAGDGAADSELVCAAGNAIRRAAQPVRGPAIPGITDRPRRRRVGGPGWPPPRSCAASARPMPRWRSLIMTLDFTGAIEPIFVFAIAAFRGARAPVRPGHAERTDRRHHAHRPA